MFNALNRLLQQKKLLVALFIIVVMIMLVAGFKPRGYRVFNRTKLLPDGKGMRFTAPSIIFTKDAWPFGRPQTGDTAFSVLLTLTPLHPCPWGIPVILSFCDTANNDNVIFGQYRHGLIVRNEKDESRNELFLDSIFQNNKVITITVTSGSYGMKLFVNGKCRKMMRERVIQEGFVVHPGRIVVANSPNGNSAWEGSIKSIGILNRELSEEELIKAINPISNQMKVISKDQDNSVALYDFAKKIGDRIPNEIGNNKSLYVPKLFTVLKKSILILPERNFKKNIKHLPDYTVNFFGFIPFGFLLSQLLCLSGKKRKTAILFTTGISGLFSLFIELVQVYIPTRSSELSDLLLNTLGALCGALLIVLHRKGQYHDIT
jgi:VanZ family protein